MSKIEWQSSFETGIDIVDRGNRQLVDLINHLERNAYVRNTQAEAQQVLSDLVRIVIPQFKAEETLLAEHRDAYTDKHAEYHQDFISQMGSYLRKLKMGGSIPVIAFLSFLKAWLINHVLRVDTQLRKYNGPRYQKQSRISPPPAHNIKTSTEASPLTEDITPEETPASTE